MVQEFRCKVDLIIEYRVEGYAQNSSQSLLIAYWGLRFEYTHSDLGVYSGVYWEYTGSILGVC